MSDRSPGSALLWRLFCAALTLLILWLSLLPPDSVPSVGLGWDKLDHAAAIAVVTLLAFLSFSYLRWAASAAFMYGLSLGVLIELFQAIFTSNRSAEGGDLLADLIGAGFVFCLISLIQRRWNES